MSGPPKDSLGSPVDDLGPLMDDLGDGEVLKPVVRPRRRQGSGKSRTSKPARSGKTDAASADVDEATRAHDPVAPAVPAAKTTDQPSAKTDEPSADIDEPTEAHKPVPPSARAARNRGAAAKTADEASAKADRAATKADRAADRTTKQKAKALKRNKRRQRGLGQYLAMPDLRGPKIAFGILWFATAVLCVLLGSLATTGLWAIVAAAAAWQVTAAWDSDEFFSPTFSRGLAAAGAASIVVASGVGTTLAGWALIGIPILLVFLHMMMGAKPVDSGAALIGTILSAVAAGSVVLVVRAETWAGLFLVVAVSLYDAGYFVGAAESASRIEGPITGIIGVLAVTFAASAMQVAPFDQATAWIAGGLMAIACPLGQMVVSAFLPSRDARVPAMRRLDAYLVAAPLMYGTVVAIGV